ncbi:phage major capsid protein, P2 family [Delftia acidovorans]|uniref:phage major capsid protein, P2 family n=1 Tax=Delftia TaxID=80865 RepID=UPI000BC33BC6|nr:MULTISPECIES: phage major capsid protein, P2 family [Delftia]ATH13841.1 phage major capsid protein, P2 family [Delftia acidovorans]
MLNTTRKLYNDYMARQAQMSGVSDASLKFNVDPTVQQRLETKIQESSEFLGLININGVAEQSGEKVGLGVGGTIASRTDTSGNGVRKTSDPTTMDSGKYFCRHTDYDTHLTYAKIDSWAKFKDFQTRISGVVAKRCALDRIMIGWNGRTAADNTNRVQNPLLQDVNIGWLENIRQKAAARVMSEGKQAGKVSVGSGGDYKNLDALVFDVTNTLLDTWHQEDPGLVAITGRKLMHDKLFPLVSDYDAPTERLAADIVRSQKRLGNLPGLTVPYFPADSVLVTRLDNLSIYYQNGARRRAIKEVPERNRIEFYESSNDDYVIEDYGLCALVENIEILE